jgi:hypothetical protein
MSAEKKESFPLSWPDDWPRTRPQDQRGMASWKRTANQYRDALVVELTRMESPSAVISSNVPLNLRGAMTPGVEPRDVGVAVYFSRKVKEDFSWQDVLSIRDPIAATEGQIQDSFKRLAQLYHPDRGGDIAMFHKVTSARDSAMRWLNRKTNQDFGYVIAADQFKEVRLNMCAIGLTIKAIRQIERCGTSSLLERAFKGFSALPAYAGADAERAR